MFEIMRESSKQRGRKAFLRTYKYQLNGKLITAQEVADLAKCTLAKAQKYLGQYAMPAEKFIKLMKKEN